MQFLYKYAYILTRNLRWIVFITIENQSPVIYDEESDKNKKIDLPECVFFNETENDYDSNSCYVLARNSNSTICACSHNSYFGVKKSKFKVQANAVDLSEFKEFNWHNFKKNPWGLLLAICIIIICLFLIFAIPTKEDLPLLQHDLKYIEGYCIHEHKIYEYRVITHQKIQSFILAYFMIFEP